jgi:hypothetical protein
LLCSIGGDWFLTWSKTRFIHGVGCFGVAMVAYIAAIGVTPFHYHPTAVAFAAYGLCFMLAISRKVTNSTLGVHHAHLLHGLAGDHASPAARLSHLAGRTGRGAGLHGVGFVHSDQPLAVQVAEGELLHHAHVLSRAGVVCHGGAVAHLQQEYVNRTEVMREKK